MIAVASSLLNLMPTGAVAVVSAFVAVMRRVATTTSILHQQSSTTSCRRFHHPMLTLVQERNEEHADRVLRCEALAVSLYTVLVPDAEKIQPITRKTPKFGASSLLRSHRSTPRSEPGIEAEICPRECRC